MRDVEKGRRDQRGRFRIFLDVSGSFRAHSEEKGGDQGFKKIRSGPGEDTLSPCKERGYFGYCIKSTEDGVTFFRISKGNNSS